MDRSCRKRQAPVHETFTPLAPPLQQIHGNGRPIGPTSAASEGGCKRTRYGGRDTGMAGGVVRHHGASSGVVANNMVQNDATSRMKVVVRLRPPIAEDQQSEQLALLPAERGPDGVSAASSKAVCVDATGDNGAVSISKPFQETRSFQYDSVLDSGASQAAAYHTIAQPMVRDVCDGFNGTVIAYGQTGAGKTHTIFGGDVDYSTENVHCPAADLPGHCGVVPRAVHDLFCHSRQQHRRGVRVVITVSMLEIYVEEVTDLLASNCGTGTAESRGGGNASTGAYDASATGSDGAAAGASAGTGTGTGTGTLAIREDPKHGVFVEGLTRRTVHSAAEVMSVIQHAVNLRRTSATLQNAKSSRSHVLLQITVDQDDVQARVAQAAASRSAGTRGSVGGGGSNELPDASRKRSTLSIVDLAGSERVSKSGSVGLRLEEAKTINRSIAALGNCVSALAAQGKAKAGSAAGGGKVHIPFRDSKLTRLLTDSLGGNTKTCLCACVGPSVGSYDETHSTLLLAQRAMAVRDRAVVNLVPRPAAHATPAPLGAAASSSQAHRGGDSLANHPVPTPGATPMPLPHGGSGHGHAGDRNHEETWRARERELVSKYSSIIDQLQQEIARQNLVIAQLQEREHAPAAPALCSEGGGDGETAHNHNETLHAIAAALMRVAGFRPMLLQHAMKR